MNEEFSDYRHPKHEEAAELLRQGVPAKEVVRRLSIGNHAVLRIRRIEGIPAWSCGTTREDKLTRFSVPEPGGHTGWNGRRTRTGTPSIRHLGVEIAASHVAFEVRTGRPPVGIVKAECGVNGCLTPEHIGDARERSQLRMLERSLLGLPTPPWDVCAQGKHSWEEGGRIQRDLTPYCQGCNTEKVSRSREWDRQESTTA